MALVLALALAGSASAQERVARVSVLTWRDSGLYHEVTYRGFVAGLREQGFVEGKNLVLIQRSADFDFERFKPLARELAQAKVDEFFAPATQMATAAWYAATRRSSSRTSSTRCGSSSSSRWPGRARGSPG